MATVRVLAAEITAETAQFQARMTAASAALERLERPGISATRAVYQLRGGLEQLTAQLVGLPGPLGRVAQGLVTLGGGGGILLTVTAAAGGLALIYKELVGPIDAVTKKNEELAASLRGTSSVAERLNDALRETASVAQQSQGKLAGLLLAAPFGIGQLPLVQDVATGALAAKNERAAAALEAGALALRQRRIDQGNALIVQREHENALLGASTEEVARLTAQWAGYDRQTVDRLGQLAAEHEARQRNLELDQARLDLLQQIAAIQLPDIGPLLAAAPTPQQLTQELAQRQALENLGPQGRGDLNAILDRVAGLGAGIEGGGVFTPGDLQAIVALRQQQVDLERQANALVRASLTPQQLYAQGLRILQAAEQQGLITKQQAAQAEAHLQQAERAHAVTAIQSAQLLVQSAVQMLEALRRGGPGGVLGFIGGALGAISRIPGLSPEAKAELGIGSTIATAIGGFIDVLDSHQQDRHVALTNTIDSALQPVGELLVIVSRDRLSTANDIDAFARLLEQVADRRVTVRLGA